MIFRSLRSPTRHIYEFGEVPTNSSTFEKPINPSVRKELKDLKNTAEASLRSSGNRNETIDEQKWKWRVVDITFPYFKALKREGYLTPGSTFFYDMANKHGDGKMYKITFSALLPGKSVRADQKLFAQVSDVDGKSH